MFERFTDRARRVVILAQEEARMLNHNYVGTEHILLGLIHEGEGVGAKALESLGVSLEVVRQRVEEIIGKGLYPPTQQPLFTPRAKKVLELSLREALRSGHNYIGTEHILLGLIREGDGVAAQVLVKLGADADRTHEQVARLLSGQNPTPMPTSRVITNPLLSTSVMLDQFGRNLTQRAREGRLDPVIGLEKEIERVIQVLSRRTKNNPVLVGAPGVGKTAVVEGLAQKIVKNDVPETIKDKHLYTLDLGALVADARYLGDFEERLRKVLEEILFRGDIVLFFEDLRTFRGSTGTGKPTDAGSLLEQALLRGEVQVIGTVAATDYRGLLEASPVLRSSFVPVQVEEATVQHTVEILKGLRGRYEEHHRLSITDGALIAAAELANRRLPDSRLPGKAIDLLDEAAALRRMRYDAGPPILREYEEEIRRLRLQKESAVDEQDFDTAAELRDREKRLLSKKAAVEKAAKAGDRPDVCMVTEDVVAETLAIMLGLSADGGVNQDVKGADIPPFPPAAMTDDDREIWGMA
jgi:ATP-dependent Clp protease ATP-binding subunit ClpC